MARMSVLLAFLAVLVFFLAACGSKMGFIEEELEEELVEAGQEIVEESGEALPGTGAAIAGGTNASSTNQTVAIINITITNISANASTNVTLNKSDMRNLSVEFLLDFEGSAIFVRTPSDVRIVIDGGTNRDGMYLVKRLRKEKSITTIDHTIATNALDNSVGGLDSVILNYNMTKVWYPQLPITSNPFKNLIDYATLVAASRQAINSSQELEVDDFVALELLVPFESGLFNSSEDNSVVIKLSYGELSLILLSDCAADCQAALIERFGTKLKAQLASFDTQLAPELAQLITPEVVITESGQDIAGAKLYSNGTVIFESDGKSYVVAVG